MNGRASTPEPIGNTIRVVAQLRVKIAAFRWLGASLGWFLLLLVMKISFDLSAQGVDRRCRLNTRRRIVARADPATVTTGPAADRNPNRTSLEAGGARLEDLPALAEISVGCMAGASLTKAIKAVGLSLRCQDMPMPAMRAVIGAGQARSGRTPQGARVCVVATPSVREVVRRAAGAGWVAGIGAA